MRKLGLGIKPSIIAGLWWFAVIFAAGFVLGTLRALVTGPLWGEVMATVFEVPVMWALAWLSCGWLIRTHRVGPGVRPRLVMGLVFFTVLMLAEQALGVYGFGRSLAEQRAVFREVPALVGLAAQLVTAGFPLLQRIFWR